MIASGYREIHIYLTVAYSCSHLLSSFSFVSFFFRLFINYVTCSPNRCMAGWLKYLLKYFHVHSLTYRVFDLLAGLLAYHVACLFLFLRDLSLRFLLYSFIIFFASKARLPVKWMPPESLFFGESSTMSDV